MKLLYCDECGDVFNLNFELKQCSCGKVKGKYINRVEAVVNGAGFSLAIGNGSKDHAILNMLSEKDKNINREQAIERYKIWCWVRPHQGIANPHTTINKNLK